MLVADGAGSGGLSELAGSFPFEPVDDGFEDCCSAAEFLDCSLFGEGVDRLGEGVDTFSDRADGQWAGSKDGERVTGLAGAGGSCLGEWTEFVPRVGLFGCGELDDGGASSGEWGSEPVGFDGGEDHEAVVGELFESFQQPDPDRFSCQVDTGEYEADVAGFLQLGEKYLVDVGDFEGVALRLVGALSGELFGDSGSVGPVGADDGDERPSGR